MNKLNVPENVMLQLPDDVNVLKELLQIMQKYEYKCWINIFNEGFNNLFGRLWEQNRYNKHQLVDFPQSISFNYVDDENQKWRIIIDNGECWRRVRRLDAYTCQNECYIKVDFVDINPKAIIFIN